MQALTTDAGPSLFSIVLQTLKDELTKPDDQRFASLKINKYVIRLSFL